MNPKDFSDPLTFPQVQPAGESFQQLLDGLAQNAHSDIHGSLGMNPKDFCDYPTLSLAPP